MTSQEITAKLVQRLHNEGVFVALLDQQGQEHTLQQVTGEAGATFYRCWDGKVFVAQEIQSVHFLFK